MKEDAYPMRLSTDCRMATSGWKELTAPVPEAALIDPGAAHGATLTISSASGMSAYALW